MMPTAFAHSVFGTPPMLYRMRIVITFQRNPERLWRSRRLRLRVHGENQCHNRRRQVAASSTARPAAIAAQSYVRWYAKLSSAHAALRCPSRKALESRFKFARIRSFECWPKR